MSVNWDAYDRFDWEGAAQTPLDTAERDALADFVANMLELPAEVRERCWGFASPPGRFAATVIRVSAGTPHRYSDLASSQGIAEIGVKVFKLNQDAEREAKKLLPFHRDEIAMLPGLPNPHVQQSLAADTARDDRGRQRSYLIQEWITGETLEDLIRRKWPQQPPSTSVVRAILKQLFTGIIIPLWRVGTVWWDVRDANYCWDDNNNRLSLIDVDSLAAYSGEILQTPGIWRQREKGTTTALQRLRQMTLRIVLSQGLGPKSRVEAKLRQSWQTLLEPALRRLGRDPAAREVDTQAATAAFHAFLNEMSS